MRVAFWLLVVMDRQHDALEVIWWLESVEMARGDVEAVECGDGMASLQIEIDRGDR